MTDKKILLVLGAGVSMDAQLPGWMTLVNRLIEFNPTARRRWAEFVKDDTSEPSRKAEYIASIVESGEDAPTRSLDELIRDALYKRSKHPQPGQLADSIARLVAILGDRVTVLTTNYDVLAEEALRTYCPDVTISSVDYKSWVADSPDLSVIHLHGILKPREDPIGDVILTQSSFLRHQSSIQSFIEDGLVECDIALFVGMSVTDPNIIGPLWRLKARTGIKPDVYNVAIVGMPTLQAHQSPASRSLSAARSYAYRCAEFLESSFAVHNVYAKTFAQVSQILYDAALFATDPGRYLSDDENVSTRYGVRLSRCLDSAYASLGCEPDSDFPVGKSGIDVSNALYTELSYQSADFSRMTDQYKIDPRVPLAEFGGIAQFLQRCASGLRRSHNEELRGIYEAHGQEFAREQFSLFAWLRSRNSAEYDFGLRLVGTSAYTHRQPWSMNRSVEVVPGTGYPAVECILTGKPFITRGYDPRPNALWGTIAVTPFTVTSPTSHPMLKGVDMDVLQVGAVSLNSTFHLVAKNAQDAPQVDATGLGKPVSILSYLSLGQQAELFTRLSAVGERICSPTQAFTHSR
ncbi:MAG TPA: SIR2 family protein [Actinomycetota bacterium]|nr:SIR2 family protein [Actinomycetota bacterium]